MNTKLFFLLLLSLGLTTSAFPQGSLTPPGAPAPTMKTLDQIEPRKEVNSTNTPGSAGAVFIISQPGSYYLAANLAGEAGKAGIQISASGVTLDLMGFELTGVASSLSGVSSGAGATNIAIQNGTMRGWGQDGVDTGNVTNCSLRNLLASGNGGRGVNAGVGSLLANCAARNNTGDGLVVGNGSAVKDCVATGNTGSGIVGGDSATVIACNAQSNSANGITTANGALVKNCTAHENGSGSTGIGIATGSRASVVECVANQNRNDGIRAASGCHLAHNTSDGNGVGVAAHGIHTTGTNNRIDSNHADGNTGNGIRSDGGAGADITIRNSARNNTAANYSPASGPTLGPLGSPDTATSPWANFFLLASFNLTVTKAGSGAGTVTSSPAGINCGATCASSFDSGTIVTLTAAPAGNSTFAGWSGACTGTGSCVVTMDAAKSVNATFSLAQFSMTVTKAGNGSGTVTSAPTGIDCGATCASSFDPGTTVTLTATPAGNSSFAGWSGPCTGTGSCVVTMDAARSVTATFTLVQFTLTVGNGGGGTVTSSPAGISCGATCASSFNSGTVVSLSATPNAGATFFGWGGGACTGTGTCNVTMTSARSVTATFGFPLTVSKSGTGTGTVTSSPAGINCGATCSATFTNATNVTLTAAAAVGSTFTGWSGGGCSGTGTCSTTMTSAQNVVAAFSSP